MSITTAQVIIDDIEAILQDESNEFWSAAEHLKAINDGTKEICVIKPDAYVITDSVTLAAGITQDLPAGGFQLINITCNMGVSPGATPGKAIRLIERQTLDSMNPNWRSESANAVVDYYMYDEKVPLKFEVSPPQPSSAFGYVNMSYAKVPAEIAADATILVPDIYRTALFYYGMSRAFLKTSDVPSSANKVTTYYSAFLNVLGVRQGVEERDDPNAD